MKITTTGSLGNVAKPLVEKLVAAGHEVTVITTQAVRKTEIEALGANAAVGSISDSIFLAQAFEGADAVYTMMPPAMGAVNMLENIAQAGQAYAKAIQTAGIRRVVMLSSVGADSDAGIVTRDFLATGAKVIGQIKLAQFAEEFKAKYLQD